MGEAEEREGGTTTPVIEWKSGERRMSATARGRLVAESAGGARVHVRRKLDVPSPRS
jgi:hypothetical protein